MAKRSLGLAERSLLWSAVLSVVPQLQLHAWMCLQELLLRAFMHVCNGPLHDLAAPPPPQSTPPSSSSAGSSSGTPSPASSPGGGNVPASLYRPRTLTAAAAFEFTGRVQFWTVPEAGMYRITARGAQAADGAHRCVRHCCRKARATGLTLVPQKYLNQVWVIREWGSMHWANPAGTGTMCDKLGSVVFFTCLHS